MKYYVKILTGSTGKIYDRMLTTQAPPGTTYNRREIETEGEKGDWKPPWNQKLLLESLCSQYKKPGDLVGDSWFLDQKYIQGRTRIGCLGRYESRSQSELEGENAPRGFVIILLDRGVHNQSGSTDVGDLMRS